MNLSMIQLKIGRLKYKNLEALDKDVKLMCSNCIQYDRDSSYFSDIARDIQSLWEEAKNLLKQALVTRKSIGVTNEKSEDLKREEEKEEDIGEEKGATDVATIDGEVGEKEAVSYRLEKEEKERKEKEREHKDEREAKEGKERAEKKKEREEKEREEKEAERKVREAKEIEEKLSEKKDKEKNEREEKEREIEAQKKKEEEKDKKKEENEGNEISTSNK
jgi:hypothetical protein